MISGASGTGATATYATSGTKNITLTVTDHVGQTNSISTSATVNIPVTPPADAPPVALFTEACSPTACWFDGTGSTDDKGIVSYAWSMPDNSTFNIDYAHAMAVYPSGATHTVSLTVTDNNGQTNTFTKVVKMDAPPVAAFTVTCAGLVCTLNGSTSTDDNLITTYTWSAPGAVIAGASGSGATATFTTSGTKNITLTVTDHVGQTNSITKAVTVGP